MHDALALSAGFEELADHLPSPVWACDAQGRTFWYSRVWYDYIGQPPGSHFAQHWLAFFHPADRDYLSSLWSGTCHDPAVPFDVAARIRRHDAVYRWFRIQARPVRDAAGAVRRWIGTCIDIDERKQAESAWRATEQRLALVLEAAELGTWEIDLTTGAVEASSRVRNLFGVTPTQPLRNRSDWRDFVVEEDRALIQKAMDAAGQGDGRYRVEFRVQHPSDGAIRWVRSDGHLHHDGQGRPTRLIGVTADVTEQQAAESALRESELRYRLLFERNPDGVFSVDLNGRFIVANPACEAISGYSAAELRERTFLELCAPDQLAVTMELFRSKIGQLETALIRKDGRRVDVWITGEPFVSGGKIVALHCTARDITERKRFQAELERMVAERTRSLEETTAQLNEFCYSLAHDLSAPLRAQESYSRLLLEEFGQVLGDVGTSYAKRIAENAHRQASLVADLLTHTSIGRTDLPIEPVSLEIALAEARIELAHREQMMKASIEVAVLHGPVLANRASLHLVLRNLLSNALKFVPRQIRPNVRIWTELTGNAEGSLADGAALNQSVVRLWVEDNGIGIPEQGKKKVFGVFQRLHPKETYGGTGIGLAVVKRAVERMGGRVGFEAAPAPGKGTRFWVDLPQHLTPPTSSL